MHVAPHVRQFAHTCRASRDAIGRRISHLSQYDHARSTLSQTHPNRTTQCTRSLHGVDSSGRARSRSASPLDRRVRRELRRGGRCTTLPRAGGRGVVLAVGGDGERAGSGREQAHHRAVLAKSSPPAVPEDLRRREAGVDALTGRGVVGPEVGVPAVQEIDVRTRWISARRRRPAEPAPRRRRRPCRTAARAARQCWRSRS